MGASLLTTKKLLVLVLLFFGVSKAENFTFVKVNFETRKLLEEAENKFHVDCLLEIVFHRDDGIIRILKNGDTTVYQVRGETTNPIFLFCPRNEDSQHVGNDIEENW